MTDDVSERWLEALAARHLTSCTFAEVTRALRALSALYVERRDRLGRGCALVGAGKRAAFALFYGPLHFFITRAIVRALGAAAPPLNLLVDLGCGTGAAGAAWALEAGGLVPLLGIDRHPWAVREATWTYRTLGLHGRARCGDVLQARLGRRPGGVVLAYVVNELADEPRERLLSRLLAAGRQGHRILVIEPVARRVAPWWERWRTAFTAANGRADTWELSLPLPPLVRALDRAAGLDHRVVTARTLWLPASPGFEGAAPAA